MEKKRKRVVINDDELTKRHRRMSVLLSEKEERIINDYLEKNHIANKSKWAREVILGVICRNMVEDYPTLFDEHDMRR